MDDMIAFLSCGQPFSRYERGRILHVDACGHRDSLSLFMLTWEPRPSRLFLREAAPQQPATRMALARSRAWAEQKAVELALQGVEMNLTGRKNAACLGMRRRAECRYCVLLHDQPHKRKATLGLPTQKRCFAVVNQRHAHDAPFGVEEKKPLHPISRLCRSAM